MVNHAYYNNLTMKSWKFGPNKRIIRQFFNLLDVAKIERLQMTLIDIFKQTKHFGMRKSNLQIKKFRKTSIVVFSLTFIYKYKCDSTKSI